MQFGGKKAKLFLSFYGVTRCVGALSTTNKLFNFSVCILLLKARDQMVKITYGIHAILEVWKKEGSIFVSIRQKHMGWRTSQFVSWSIEAPKEGKKSRICVQHLITNNLILFIYYFMLKVVKCYNIHIFKTELRLRNKFNEVPPAILKSAQFILRHDYSQILCGFV